MLRPELACCTISACWLRLYSREVAFSPLPCSSSQIAGSSLFEAFSEGDSPDIRLLISQKQLLRIYNSAQTILKSLKLSSNDANVRRQDAATKMLLLQNPEHPTALNLRKRLVLDGRLSACTEKHFTETLMTIPSSSKCLQLWHHHHFVQIRLEAQQEQEKEKQKLAQRCIQLYPRNYAAWTSLTQSTLSMELLDHICEHVRRNVSDHSGVTIHVSMVHRLGDECIWREHSKEVLNRLEEVAHFETPWLHLRMLLQLGKKKNWCIRRLVDEVSQRFTEELEEDVKYSVKAAATTLAQEREEQKQKGRVNARRTLQYIQTFT